MVMNKKGKTNGTQTIFLIVVVALAIQALGIYDFQSALGIEGEEPTTPSELCSDPSNTFTFGSLYTKWGSQITSGENVAWWLNGAYQGTKAVDSTTTLNNGDELAFVVGVDSSTRYANYFTAEMPCGPTYLSSLVQNEENYLITADQDFTITLINSDNGNVNSATANETISTSEYGQWEVRIDGTSEQGISPNGNLWFIVGYDKNNFTGSTMTLGGQSPTTDSIPSWMNTVNNFNYKVFKLPGCPTGTLTSGSKICQIRPGDLYIEAKSGVDPTPDATSILNITVANEDYDLDTNTNQILGSGTPVVQDDTGAISGFPIDGFDVFLI